MSRRRYNGRRGPAPTSSEWDHYRKLREAKEARRAELAKAAGDQGDQGGNSLSVPFGKLTEAYGAAKHARRARQRV